MKRILALLLVILVVAFAFAGCKKKNAETPTPSESSSSSSSSSEVVSSEEENIMDDIQVEIVPSDEADDGEYFPGAW